MQVINASKTITDKKNISNEESKLNVYGAIRSTRLSVGTTNFWSWQDILKNSNPLSTEPVLVENWLEIKRSQQEHLETAPVNSHVFHKCSSGTQVKDSNNGKIHYKLFPMRLLSEYNALLNIIWAIKGRMHQTSINIPITKWAIISISEH